LCAGTILGGTISTTYSSRGNNNADAVYTIRTDDGVNIMVTEKAHIPNINIWFETASEKYYWLNNVTAYAHEIPSKGVSNIHVYAVSLLPEIPADRNDKNADYFTDRFHRLEFCSRNACRGLNVGAQLVGRVDIRTSRRRDRLSTCFNLALNRPRVSFM
jgi:hypothetical protein